MSILRSFSHIIQIRGGGKPSSPKSIKTWEAYRNFFIGNNKNQAQSGVPFTFLFFFAEKYDIL